MGTKAVVVAADGFEDIELRYPYYRLREEGVEVDVATPDGEEIQGKNGYVPRVDLSVEECDTTYEFLVIPGGRSPENLRLHGPEPAELVRELHDSGSFISAVSHGPQVLISAELVENRQVACSPSIADDVENAGATFVDEAVVVDGKVVSSRRPDDLPELMGETVRKVKRARVKD